MKTWYGVPDTNIEVSEDGTEFRWTFDRDGAEFLATELHPDGTSREMYLALRFADEVQRIEDRCSHNVFCTCINCTTKAD